MSTDDIMNTIENNALGIDDTFAFHCKGCGKCCKHREDILLTPRDLFCAAKHLDMSPLAFFRTYCEVYVGHSSGLLVLRLKPSGKTNDCPLLNGKRCRVHAAKPAVCALFPLGRAVKYGQESDNSGSVGEPEIVYFHSKTDCPTNRKQTVRTWLGRFGLEEHDTFQMKWAAEIVHTAQIVKTQGRNLGMACHSVDFPELHVHCL